MTIANAVRAAGSFAAGAAGRGSCAAVLGKFHVADANNSANYIATVDNCVDATRSAGFIINLRSFDRNFNY